MIRTIGRVARSEGIGSAVRRAQERIGEAMRIQMMLARGAVGRPHRSPILNISATGPFARLGGLPTQLIARLDEERALRDVAWLYPGIIELAVHARRAPQFTSGDALFDAGFERSVAYALSVTGASAIHIEGTAGLPIGSILEMTKSGIDVVLGVHDFSLFCARPHLIEEPMGVFCGYCMEADRCHRCLRETSNAGPNDQAQRRATARQLLAAARAVVFPSTFLRDKHQELFALPDLNAHVIEPAVPDEPIARAVRRARGQRPRIAYAGSLKRHKGAHFLPEIITAFADDDVDWHIFGGGDENFLRSVRHLPHTTVHGYYRGGTLPSLLARHQIDLGMLLSIWPETWCFTLSECWAAGVPAVGFAHGAIAERITSSGGGWLSPIEEGSYGIVNIVRQWLAGELTTAIPAVTRAPRDAATDHGALYRSLNLLD
ncbi:MAG TPA: glycosyltransferase [Thermoanaerobaculia bacterium]|nr:glycosyltransferase [Thermoanaerobaculia bacterium]